MALADIQAAILAGRYFIGPHAGLRQVEHGITVAKLEEAIGRDEPEVIEDYPGDPRGRSCLVRGVTKTQEVLHAVLAITGDSLFVVTCYKPDPALWYPSNRKRRTQI